MKVHLLHEARADLTDGMAWYDRESRGLGLRLAHEVADVLRRLRRFSESGTTCGRGLRRALTADFPYAVYYAVVDDMLVITAILHQRRNPAVWQQRSVSESP
jgi:plasmid stabilization system protein ParE